MFSQYTFKQSIGWLMALVGIVCYIAGYIGEYYNCPFWPSICIKIADVLIIGVVVGYLTGVAQWSGVFKREIQDIVLGKDFIGNRNDIENIWYNVTKQMFKFKFADIHKDLLTGLKHTLPDENDVSYYEDFDADTQVEWIDKNKGIIKTIDTIAMYIVTETEKEFSYHIKSWTVTDKKKQDASLKQTISVSIDGKIQDNLKTILKPDGDELCSETKIVLKGKTRYFIKYTRSKIYNINEDYYIAFKAKYITKNLTVSLNLPDDIEGLFIERGTTKDCNYSPMVRTH